MIRIRLLASVLVAACLLGSSPALAQAIRTWVSGVGDDVNPCSRTAPCKTFAGAISKTASGGEISVLDPGGFGAVTITKSITIDGGTGSGWGSILASGGNGIVINAPGHTVILRNLSINGTSKSTSAGLNGIRFLGGMTLHVENCVIFGFTQRGIDVTLTGTGALTIRDSTIEEVTGSGIRVSATGNISTLLDNVRIQRSGTAVEVNAGGVVAIRNSVFSFSATGVSTTASGAQVGLDNSMLFGNGVGLSVGIGGTGRINNNVFANNFTGIDNDGTVNSANNNRFMGNLVNATGSAFAVDIPSM